MEGNSEETREPRKAKQLFGRVVVLLVLLANFMIHI